GLPLPSGGRNPPLLLPRVGRSPPLLPVGGRRVGVELPLPVVGVRIGDTCVVGDREPDIIDDSEPDPGSAPLPLPLALALASPLASAARMNSAPPTIIAMSTASNSHGTLRRAGASTDPAVSPGWPPLLS